MSTNPLTILGRQGTLNTLIERTNLMPNVKKLRINGAQVHVDAEEERSLLGVLRDDLGLTGAKYGCGEGRCGACTVLVDGEPVRSCVTKLGAVAAGEITTIEGLEKRRQAAPASGGFPGGGRHAVRLLHVRHDHVRASGSCARIPIPRLKRSSSS